MRYVVDRDMEKRCSLQELKELATKGDADAQFYVARSYFYGKTFNGESSVKDFNQVVFWYEKAAEQKHPYAPYYLSRMYNQGKIDGKGVRRDKRKAFFWIYITKSTFQNALESEQKVINENFDIMEKQLTEQQRMKVQEKAEKYIKKHGLIKIK